MHRIITAGAFYHGAGFHQALTVFIFSQVQIQNVQGTFFSETALPVKQRDLGQLNVLLRHYKAAVIILSIICHFPAFFPKRRQFFVVKQRSLTLRHPLHGK